MQQIIDDMNYVINKLTDLTDEGWRDRHMVAAEDYLNNAIDGGQFNDIDSSQKRRFEMASYLTAKFSQPKVKVETETEEEPTTEEPEDPPADIVELMQEVLALEWVKDNEQVLENSENIFDVAGKAIAEGKDPKQAMLDYISSNFDCSEPVPDAEETEETTEVRELDSNFVDVLESELQNELIEEYDDEKPMYEGLIETDILHTEKETIWVDEDGIEPFTEHRKKGKKSTGPVPAQVQQSEDPPEMVSIFVKEKKMERKITEIVNEFDDTIENLDTFLERLKSVNEAIKRRV